MIQMISNILFILQEKKKQQTNKLFKKKTVNIDLDHIIELVQFRMLKHLILMCLYGFCYYLTCRLKYKIQ